MLIPSATTMESKTFLLSEYPGLQASILDGYRVKSITVNDPGATVEDVEGLLTCPYMVSATEVALFVTDKPQKCRRLINNGCTNEVQYNDWTKNLIFGKTCNTEEKV